MSRDQKKIPYCKGLNAACQNSAKRKVLDQLQPSVLLLPGCDAVPQRISCAQLCGDHAGKSLRNKEGNQADWNLVWKRNRGTPGDAVYHAEDTRGCGAIYIFADATYFYNKIDECLWRRRGNANFKIALYKKRKI